MTCSAVYLADYTNQHHHEVTFAVESYAWLSTDQLKLPMNLSWKLASHYVGPLKIIEYINSFAFCLLLHDSWKVHDVFRVLKLKPAISFTPFAF